MIRALSSEPLNGRWLLTGLVGRGSSGTVYRGFDLVSERVVAIKTLGCGGSKPRLTRRARREFLDLATLRHPNLVETYDLAAAESGPVHAGSPFFTMELLEEASLSRFRGGELPGSVSRLALDLLAALGCVHGHGLVHNDVKPSNVLLERNGEGGTRAKLSDLGLASRSSHRGGWRGTLHYSAPEAIAGGQRGPRSDLYSLGVLLFEAATGSLPFSESDPAAALEWHLRGSRPEEGSTRSISPVLGRVIGRLLAVRPEARFVRARDAWEEIAEAAPDQSEGCRHDGRRCEGPLSGRSAERRRLVDWLAAAARTGGRLTVRGGEGAGLSRFAREAEILGRAEGWAVHPWRCTGDDPLFSPFSRPLREIILRAYGNGGRRRPPTEGDVLALLGGPALWNSPRRVFEEASWPLAHSLAAFLLANPLDRPLLIVLDDYERADEGTRLVVRSLASAPCNSAAKVVIVTTLHEPAAETKRESRVRELRAWEARAHPPRRSFGVRRPPQGRAFETAAGAPLRHGPGALQAQGALLDGEVLHLDPLSVSQACRLLENLSCLGRIHPHDVETLCRHAEGMPGRLVDLAHVMAGKQRTLFPPLSEPPIGQRCEAEELIDGSG